MVQKVGTSPGRLRSREPHTLGSSSHLESMPSPMENQHTHTTPGIPRMTDIRRASPALQATHGGHDGGRHAKADTYPQQPPWHTYPVAPHMSGDVPWFSPHRVASRDHAEWNEGAGRSREERQDVGWPTPEQLPMPTLFPLPPYVVASYYPHALNGYPTAQPLHELTGWQAGRHYPPPPIPPAPHRWREEDQEFGGLSYGAAYRTKSSISASTDSSEMGMGGGDGSEGGWGYADHGDDWGMPPPPPPPPPPPFMMSSGAGRRSTSSEVASFLNRRGAARQAATYSFGRGGPARRAANQEAMSSLPPYTEQNRTSRGGARNGLGANHAPENLFSHEPRTHSRMQTSEVAPLAASRGNGSGNHMSEHVPQEQVSPSKHTMGNTVGTPRESQLDGSRASAPIAGYLKGIEDLYTRLKATYEDGLEAHPAPASSGDEAAEYTRATPDGADGPPLPSLSPQPLTEEAFRVRQELLHVEKQWQRLEALKRQHHVGSHQVISLGPVEHISESAMRGPREWCEEDGVGRSAAGAVSGAPLQGNTLRGKGPRERRPPIPKGPLDDASATTTSSRSASSLQQSGESDGMLTRERLLSLVRERKAAAAAARTTAGG